MSTNIKDEILNEQLLESIKNAADGANLENVSQASTDYVRDRIRESGFARSILPLKPVTHNDLDRDLDERLRIIYEMEGRQQRARTISFDGQPEAANYYGRRFEVTFTKITTPEWTKNITELLTYRMDLRKVVTDNGLNDVETHEDQRFIAEVNSIVGSVGGNGEAGVPQNVEISGGITRDTYKEILKSLEDRNLDNGMFLMNRSTSKAFLGWPHDEIGGPLAERLFLEGTSALNKGTILGVQHAFTIKRDIVPDGVVFHFASPAFLGKGCELRSPSMYVKKEHDILRMRADEIIGMTIANVASVHKTTFVSA